MQQTELDDQLECMCNVCACKQHTTILPCAGIEEHDVQFGVAAQELVQEPLSGFDEVEELGRVNVVSCGVLSDSVMRVNACVCVRVIA